MKIKNMTEVEVIGISWKLSDDYLLSPIIHICPAIEGINKIEHIDARFVINNHLGKSSKLIVGIGFVKVITTSKDNCIPKLLHYEFTERGLNLTGYSYGAIGHTGYLMQDGKAVPVYPSTALEFVKNMNIRAIEPIFHYDQKYDYFIGASVDKFTIYDIITTTSRQDGIISKDLHFSNGKIRNIIEDVNNYNLGGTLLISKSNGSIIDYVELPNNTYFDLLI